MATEIQEPSDLPEGSITDQTASRYEILVYEKASDNAGIKKIGIAPWKDYLNYNEHKVNNVASYVGMPENYPWDGNSDVEYTGTKLSDQVKNLSNKLGISSEPGTFEPTVLTRINALQDSVDGYHTGESPVPGAGLLNRMSSAENDIDSIKEEIGSSGGSSGSLTARIGTLETTVGDSTGGLVKDVDDLQNVVGGTGAGLVKDVNDLQNVVSDPTDGLVKKVNDLKSVVGDSSDGLVKDVADNTNNISALDTDVNNPSTGLKKKVGDLETSVDGDGTLEHPGLLNRVSSLETAVSGVYKYRGNITAANSPTGTTSITVDGKTVQLSSLENGEVFNINPSDPDVPSITINDKTYTRGSNVAWVKPESGTGYFDELGTAIDVAEINQLKETVNKIKYYTTNNIPQSSTWSSQSLNLENGIYQFTMSAKVSGRTKLSSIIAPFYGNVVDVSTTGDIIDLNSNFTDYWELDNDNNLMAKSVSYTRRISYMKIGEV